MFADTLVADRHKKGKGSPPFLWVENEVGAEYGRQMRNEKQIYGVDFHLGKMIKDELKKQGRTAVWLARQVHCTPENIYKAFRQQWITMPLLFRISRVLGHDFFQDISEKL